MVVTCGWNFKDFQKQGRRVTNIAMVCNHQNQISSRPRNPARYFFQKKFRAWFGGEKSLFEHFYIKTLNWNDPGFIIQKKYDSLKDINRVTGCDDCDSRTSESRVTNIAMVCNHQNQISSKPQNPTRYFLWKRVPGLIWREKSLFEHFYIKTLNWNDLGFIIQKKWFLKRHQQGDCLWWLWFKDFRKQGH